MRRVSAARVGDADVEVAVGAEDDAVDAALAEVLAGDLVREPDPRAAGGRAGRAQFVQDAQDLPGLVAGRGRKAEAGAAGVRDDRDAVVLVELLDDELHRAAQQAELVLARASSPTCRSGRRR